MSTPPEPRPPAVAHAFLSDRPDDRHTIAARALLGALRRHLGDAGLGIAGSVGRGDHTGASDLDLVVAGDFRRDASFALTYQGLGVAILCLRSRATPAGEAQILSAGAVDPNTPYTLNARVIDDPAGHLRRVREALGRVAAAKAARVGERRAHLLGRARALLDRLEDEDDELRAGPLRFELLSVLLTVWCIEQGVTLDEKSRFLALFPTIAERDPALHALLAEALPLRAASVPLLAQAIARFQAGRADGETPRRPA